MKVFIALVLMAGLAIGGQAEDKKSEAKTPAAVISLSEQEQKNFESIAKELDERSARRSVAVSDLEKVSNTSFVGEAQLRLRVYDLEIEVLRTLADNYKLRLYAKYAVSEQTHSLQLDGKAYVIKKIKSE